jgi:hypothetical protein
VFAAALCALALSACSESSKPASTAATTPAATEAPAATPAPVATETVATAAVVTGIADCDTFLSAYEQCITEHAPAEVRDQLAAGISQWKTAWQQMAANDASKASLPQICKQARDSSAPALQAYGCSL